MMISCKWNLAVHAPKFSWMWRLKQRFNILRLYKFSSKLVCYAEFLGVWIGMQLFYSVEVGSQGKALVAAIDN
jgi:hypothetical protein